jgi:hypothetical protein
MRNKPLALLTIAALVLLSFSFAWLGASLSASRAPIEERVALAATQTPGEPQLDPYGLDQHAIAFDDSLSPHDARRTKHRPALPASESPPAAPALYTGEGFTRLPVPTREDFDAEWSHRIGAVAPLPAVFALQSASPEFLARWPEETLIMESLLEHDRATLVSDLVPQPETMGALWNPEAWALRDALDHMAQESRAHTFELGIRWLAMEAALLRDAPFEQRFYADLTREMVEREYDSLVAAYGFEFYVPTWENRAFVAHCEETGR